MNYSLKYDTDQCGKKFEKDLKKLRNNVRL